MSLDKLISLILTLLVLAVFCFAQDSKSTPDPEKEKAKKEQDEKVMQMLDQVISDAALLRLPQNKAIVFAMAGDLYWKFDEKKSRDLFRSAASEILAHNADVEREKRESTDDMFTSFFDFNDPRQQVLPLVAKNDGELALELLLQTRPAIVAEAILKASAPNARSEGMFNFNPDYQRVRQEIALEQRFALLAADENPDKAIKMIKDSLSRGISFNAFELLQKLNKKDEKKASDLAGEIIRKIIDTDLTRREDELQAAVAFLQVSTRDIPPEVESKGKMFRFSEAQAKEVANKLVSTFMQPVNSTSMSMAMTRALPSLEKLVPDKANLLKQRQAENRKNLPTEYRRMERMEKLWSPNSTAEEILAEIPKLQNEYEKSTAYQAVAGKIAQIDDEARAKKLIDQIGDEKARTQALERFESAKISRAASAGKLEDAKKMIGGLTNKKLQVQKLVSLAQNYHKKGTEADIESANGLMKNARSLINESPEDEDELNNLMEVVRGYATVDPDVAFRLFEPIVDQINDIVHATAILSKYNKRTRSFKKGEMILRVNNSPFDGVLLFRYLNQIQLLGKADLAKMASLSDRFQRSDARSIVKLVAIQGFSKDEKKPDGPTQTDYIFTEY